MSSLLKSAVRPRPTHPLALKDRRPDRESLSPSPQSVAERFLDEIRKEWRRQAPLPSERWNTSGE
jgi:hypothetical protein